MGLSDEFKTRINKLDDDSVCHVGIENVIRQMIEKNFEDISETLELTVLLEKVGFSQAGVEELVAFIDASVTHYLLWNWIELFLEVKFTWGLPVCSSGFPYQTAKQNEFFIHRLDSEIYPNSKNFTVYNFTKPLDFQKWTETQIAHQLAQRNGKRKRFVSYFLKTNSSFPKILSK